MTFAQPFLDYEILDRVGAGAMGTVFKARHKKLNRIVALKVLKPSLARDERYVERLRREARIVASLNDPHIVTGYDLGEEGGYHFFVMEFVEGKSLRALLSEWGMVAEEYVRRVARQVAQALDHAYQRGVIHRDVKPGNILIDEAGSVKLTDMGLAKGPADLTLTRDGATVGTPQYISPEQARNPQDVDVRSDLYSLGATLYHMATGVPPFHGDTMAELITNVLNETPVSPIAINPALSEGMSLVIRKLLVKDLRVRYQTPRELLDDLDRIDLSQPPEVDVARLSDDARERPRLLMWSLLVVSLAALLTVAWWLGNQGREPAVVVPTGDEYLARLDTELRNLPTPGERLDRLIAVGLAPPLDTATRIEQRKQAAMAELQFGLGTVVGEFLEAGWPELAAWLRDPAVWPDRARCERERIQPRLRQQVGVVLGRMPLNVRQERLQELFIAIDRCIAQRDADLLVRFEHFLTTTLPSKVDGRIRAGHYAEADQLWRDADATFCDHVHEPLLEQLAEPTRRTVREKHALGKQAAQPALDVAEGNAVVAMLAEVGAVVEDLTQRLHDGAAPETIAERLTEFRRDFLEVWPAAGRFRVANEPWPQIERQFGVLQQAIASTLAQHADRRFEQRCDLAWRTFCHGSADDALRVLDETTVAPAHLMASLQRQRTALQATRSVAAAVLQAIAGRGRALVAFPRGSQVALELHTEPGDGGLRLVCEASGQPPRTAQLSEFRFTDLLTRLRQQGIDPLQGVPPEHSSLGLPVSAMAADDLADVGVLLEALGRSEHAFLVDDVWPRILRVRGEQPERLLNRSQLFARLRQAREAVLQSGSISDLETAMLACRGLGPEGEFSDAERAELRLAQRCRELERQRLALAAELGSIAPQGSGVGVGAAGDDLIAEVRMAAAVLHRDAAEGWQLRDGALEFAGGGRPWSDRPLQLLRCNPGLESRWRRTSIQVDFVVPSSTVGRRLYEFEFRGIAVLFVVAANDAVHAALVEGDPGREEHVQRGFQRAMSGALASPRAMLVPGATHRLTIEILAASALRKHADVKVLLDGVELIAERHELDPQRSPEFVLYPMQEIAVREVVVRAQGS